MSRINPAELIVKATERSGLTKRLYIKVGMKQLPALFTTVVHVATDSHCYTATTPESNKRSVKILQGRPIMYEFDRLLAATYEAFNVEGNLQAQMADTIFDFATIPAPPEGKHLHSLD